MKVLDMSLKPIFFRAIKTRAKVVEYRDFTEYWGGKLIDVDAYGGKELRDIMDGIYCGELEFKPKTYDRLLFHESGTQRTMMVECLGVKYFTGHLGFAIQLGEIIKQTNKE